MLKVDNYDIQGNTIHLIVYNFDDKDDSFGLERDLAFFKEWCSRKYGWESDVVAPKGEDDFLWWLDELQLTRQFEILEKYINEN